MYTLIRVLTPLVALLAGLPAPAQVLPPPGMVAWYSLDEAAGSLGTDDRRGLPDGSVVGGATFGAGMVANALVLNGSSSYVRVASPTFTLPADFTIDAWIFPATSDDPMAIVARQDPGSMGPEKGFVLSVHGGSLIWALANGTCGNLTCSQVLFSTTQAIPIQQWSHVAVTVDRSSSTPMVTLYVDGIVRNQAVAQIFGDVNAQSDLIIGRGPDHQPVEFFLGSVDEVEIFNRALSGAEIAALHAAGAAGKYKLACSCMYAIDWDFLPSHQISLYRMDALTGAPMSQGIPLGIGSAIGLARGPDEYLYTVTTSRNLYRVHPVTGATTLVGSLGLPSQVNVFEGDLAFDLTLPNPVLYAMWSNRLYTINTTTGAATLVATMPVALPNPFIWDVSFLAFANGKLYAVHRGPALGDPTTLYTIDPQTGQILGSMNVGNLGRIGGMDVDPATGLLYLVDGADFGTNLMHVLDPATGTLTAIGPTNLPLALSGLTFCGRCACPEWMSPSQAF